jgi:SAM-dependent methyltransferase
MPATYDPDFYDLTTPASFRGDAEWYVRKARESGGPVLELGAGTGRLTLPIARQGTVIHALDSHNGMLGRLRHKRSQLLQVERDRIVVVEADMRHFELKQDFALVMIPFRAFLHNLTFDDQLACLRCVKDHLRPDGLLALNVFHPSLEHMALHAGSLAGVWRWASTQTTSDGRIVVRSEASRYDTVRQRVHSQHRFEEFSPDGALARTHLHQLELAYLYAGDLHRLLERTGFADIRIAGGFNNEPFEHDSDEMVVEAAPAA